MTVTPRVLIVEDGTGTTASVRGPLAVAGFETAVVDSGDGALRLLDDDPPDALVVDLDLPVLDGWYLLARVGMRACRPRMVVRAPGDDPGAHRRARRLGADAVVERQAEHEAVVEALRAVIGAP